MTSESIKTKQPSSVPRLIMMFLIVTSLFSTIFYFFIIKSGHIGGGDGRYVTGIMWFPGIAAIAVCWFYSVPLETLGWRWAGAKFQLLSYVVPVGYSLVAYSIIWITGLGLFPSADFLTDSVKSVGFPISPVAAANSHDCFAGDLRLHSGLC